MSLPKIVTSVTSTYQKRFTDAITGQPGVEVPPWPTDEARSPLSTVNCDKGEESEKSDVESGVNFLPEPEKPENLDSWRHTSVVSDVTELEDFARRRCQTVYPAPDDTFVIL